MGDEEARRHHIHGQRPESIDGWKLARRRAHGVSVLRGVQLLTGGIDGIDRIHRFQLRVAVNAEHGGGHSVEVIVLQILPRAEHVAGGHFLCNDSLLQSRQVRPGICHTLFNACLHLWRSLVSSKVFPVPTPILANRTIKLPVSDGFVGQKRNTKLRTLKTSSDPLLLLPA